MRKKVGLIGGSVLVVVLVYVSCRKVDTPGERERKEELKPVSRFFDSHTSADPGVQAITSLMKRENNTYHFLESITSTVGYPRWDKTIVIKGNSALGRGNTGDTANYYYIPFVRDSQQYVNASLVVRTGGGDTAVRWLSDWQYADYGFDTTNAAAPNARKAFLTLANLDISTFGHHNYLVKDGRIFGYPDTQKLKVSVDPPSTGNGGTYGRGAEDYFTVCNKVTICVVAGNTQSARGTDGPYSSGCGGVQTIVFYCNVYMYYEGGVGSNNTGWTPVGSGYLPDPASGGNYIEGWSPPPNPCGTVNQRGGAIQVCESSWVWIDDMPSPLSPGDSLIAANLKRLYNKGLSMSNLLYDSAQSDKDERTFTYVVNGSNDTIPMFPLRGSIYESWPQLAYNYMGIWHSHQDEGPANRDQSFDGADIFKLYYHYLINKGFPVSIITTQNYIYAAVVTDPVKFKSYIKTLTNKTQIDPIKEKLDSIHIAAMNTCQNPSCNWQKKSEIGTLAITANNNSEISGIKIFRSSRQNINFTLLTN